MLKKDARTPRAALLLLVQAPEQNRVGRDNLKNRIEGGHNGIRFLNGNNLTVTLSKNLALKFTVFFCLECSFLERTNERLPDWLAGWLAGIPDESSKTDGTGNLFRTKTRKT